MVPSVESFQTEFETATARFAQGKALEQGHVPVVAARTTQGVVTQRAPRGRCVGHRGSRKGRRIKVLDFLVAGKLRVLIRDCTGQIRPVGAAYSVAALRATERDVEWEASLQGNDARDLPATDCRPHEPALTVAQEGDVVDEVHHSNVRAVVSAGSDVIHPAGIGIRHSAEVSAAAAGSGRINGTRERVECPEVEVVANLRIEINL